MGICDKKTCNFFEPPKEPDQPKLNKHTLYIIFNFLLSLKFMRGSLLSVPKKKCSILGHLGSDCLVHLKHEI